MRADEFRERAGPKRVDHGQSRDAVDQAQMLEFDERLTEARRVAEVASGDDDPIRRLPAQRLQDARGGVRAVLGSRGSSGHHQ